MVIFQTLGRCEQNYNSVIKVCILDFFTLSLSVRYRCVEEVFVGDEMSSSWWAWVNWRVSNHFFKEKIILQVLGHFISWSLLWLHHAYFWFWLVTSNKSVLEWFIWMFTHSPPALGCQWMHWESRAQMKKWYHLPNPSSNPGKNF